MNIAKSPRWNETGFVNRSTRIPVKPAAREILASEMATYFKNHPEQELSALGVTAARAKELHKRLVSASKAMQSQDGNQGALRQKRDAAQAELRRRLTALVAELRVLLDAESPLWEEFGLNIPGRRPRKAKAAGSADATLIAVGKENATLNKAA